MEKSATVRYILWVLVSLIVFMGLLPANPVWGGDDDREPATVYVLPVEGTMETGLTAFVRRGIEEAEQEGVDVLVLRIRTLGGLVEPTLEIRDMLLQTSVRTVAFVQGRAWSAGVLVTMACEHVVMGPGSSIGAAEPRPADEKTVSAVRAEVEETAKYRGRDPDILAAMVDADMAIEGVIEPGKILTLTATRAEELGIADATAGSVTEALHELGIDPIDLQVIEPTMLERFTRFATSPYVSPVLLSVGFIGVIVEFVIPGFGIPGMLGILAFASYFIGHIAAGHAGLSLAILFTVGVVLLVTEIFIPEFGVLGLTGIAAMFASIYLAAPTHIVAIRSIIITAVAMIATIVILVRLGHRFTLWRHLLLGDEISTERGYISQKDSRDLVGKRGVTRNTLRPSGAAEIDGERLDVVSEGEFIPRDTEVEVTHVQGRRIVVRAIREENRDGEDES